MTTTTTTATTVQVTIPGWLANREGLKSRVMVGVVERRSAGGVKFTGHASAKPSDHCHRCGRGIVNPASLLVGYGPDCSALLGIPRDFSEAQLDEVRAQIESIVWTGWLPVRYITFTDADGNAVNVDDCIDGGEVDTGSPRADRPAAVAVKLVTIGNAIQIRAPYSFKDAIKSLPGRRWNAVEKVWSVPASPDSAQRLVDLFAAVTCERDAGVDAQLAANRQRDHAAEHKTSTDVPVIPVVKTTPWEHQARAFAFAEKLDAVGLFLDMGCGKSKVLVDLVVNRAHERTLIISPKSVVGVWPREFAIHADGITVCAPRKGDVAKRTEAIKQAIATTSGPLVVVVNYESAWREPLATLLLKQDWDLVALDESHRIKAPGGKASMFVSKLGRRASHRLALTGTPAPHSPLDLYSQFRFLDPGVFGTSFARFRSRYAIMGGYGGHEVLGYQHQDELAEHAFRIAFRVMADDVLDLPPKLHITRTCELDGPGRKIYNDLASDLFAEVGDGSVTAANALVRLLRLQQVTSGYAPVEDDEGEVENTQVSDAKEQLLADVLDDIATDEPVVIFSRFTHDLDAIKRVCAKQGRRYGELSGRSKDGLTDDAKMSPNIDVIGANIAAGSTGIDLTRARYTVFYSVGFNLSDYEQALARTHRPGQTRPTEYIHLLVENSIDEKVEEALRQRKSVVEYVLGLSS